jgi:hypothetical protein
MTAVLIDSVSFVFTNNVSEGSEAFNFVVKTMLLFMPFFISHYLSGKYSGGIAGLIWFVGFIAYPSAFLLHGALSSSPSEYLLSIQSVLLAIAFSLMYRISHIIKKRNINTSNSIVSKVLSLNGVIVFTLFGWATSLALIFVSTTDPINNQPIPVDVSFGQLIGNLGLFFSYLLQFMFLGSLLGFVYLLNRYVVIRIVLSQHGVFLALVAAICAIIIFTPVLSYLALFVPLNHGVLTILPSGDRNPFNASNFELFIAILAISTPVILAFERQHQSTKIESAARRQMLTELQLLQQQINPHFLFNILNNLYALTLSKSDQAPELVMQLANLLRYTVYEGQKPQVCLSKEIAYLQNYLALQRIRLGADCRFSLRWPDDTENLSIPPLLLIVIVENAFKHGLDKSTKKGELTLSITIENNTLLMTCENTFRHCEEHKETGGLGLDNLYRRLTLLLPGHFELISEQRHDIWYAYIKLELTPC